jgi:hypothetical protein
MAIEHDLDNISRVAGADLSSAQFKFVESNSSGTVTVTNAAGEYVLGVLQNNPASGQAATVAVGGISKVVLGGTVSINDSIATDNAGKAVAASTGNKIVGIAIKGGASGEIGSVLLRPAPNVA